ncbi:hypothetical protein [Staphylococcus sp. RIT622]|uniref:hypothetical protein n=1 Tax=Staphylococcus sp. RIT622 TaxID=2510795 RepID=UPI00101E425C|nr:hypothetical protein [Staphylococcus sp. RIT622]MCG2544241.1 hypothetical protein [Staphylococcus epidermidis]RYL09513.1 hypothetical protein EU553_11790 [Staphylococcus sp. RIT622]
MKQSIFENELDPIMTDEQEVELKNFYELIHKDLDKDILIFQRLIEDNNDEFLLSDFTEEMKQDIESLEFAETYILNKDFMKNPRKPTLDYSNILERH